MTEKSNLLLRSSCSSNSFNLSKLSNVSSLCKTKLIFTSTTSLYVCHLF